MSAKNSLVKRTNKSQVDFLQSASQDFNQKTILEVVEEFLSLKKSEQTQRAYRIDITNFFEQQRIVYLRELSFINYPEMVRNVLGYINSFRKAERYQPDKVLNPKTVNRKAYSLSSFFKFLVNVYNYPKNPVANFTALKTQMRSTTSSLTHDEVFKIITFQKERHYKNEIEFRNYLIILFLFLLALRRNEIANLKWRDINMQRQSINVFQKGGTYKELPVPDNLLKILFEFKKEYGQKSSYIFHPVVNNRTKDLEKPISTDLIFKLVRKISESVIPFKQITPHSFRKTFIEIALNNKQDFISIINATGHSTIEMVKYYDTRNTLENNAINDVSNMI